MSVFADDEPIRIEFEKTVDGREQWVELRRELNIAVEDAFNAKMFNAKFDRQKAISGKLDASDFDLDIDLGRAMSTTSRLEMWIVDWQLYDKAGNDVDLTPAAIGQLSKGTVRILLDHIAALEGAGERLGESSPVAAGST